MRTAQLDVPGYLAASRRCFQALGGYQAGAFEWADSLPEAGWIISCEGFAATRNPYFDWIPFKAAKGEILTIRFEQPFPPRSLHAGIWMAPTAEARVFRVGSTYDWHCLDQHPTAEAREELERKLRALVRVPFTIIQHEAAVRPIIQESKALLGLHPVHEHLGFFNGLGSKGALHAPWFAACYRDYLLQGIPLPEGCDLRKNF
jgi:glycine/D-amino acid oxidase-like deaminating enzyme